MAKKLYIVEVEEVPNEPLWLISSPRDMSIFLVAFTLCTILLALGISFQVVDSPIYQNFQNTLMSDTAAIVLLVISGAAVIGLVSTLLGSLVHGVKLSKVRPSLISILVSVAMIFCFIYGCYEYNSNCYTLKEKDNEKPTWSSYTSEQYNRSHRENGTLYGYDTKRYSHVFGRQIELSTLEATSSNIYSFGFCPTYCAVTINSDNSADILLQGERRSTITPEGKTYYIKIGHSEEWQKLPFETFGPTYCPHTAYYLDHLYDDVMSAGSFSLKIPTNIGELEYHFTNN